MTAIRADGGQARPYAEPPHWVPERAQGKVPSERFLLGDVRLRLSGGDVVPVGVGCRVGHRDSPWSGIGLIIGGLLWFFVGEDEESLRRDRDT